MKCEQKIYIQFSIIYLNFIKKDRFFSFISISFTVRRRRIFEFFRRIFGVLGYCRLFRGKKSTKKKHFGANNYILNYIENSNIPVMIINLGKKFYFFYLKFYLSYMVDQKKNYR